MNIRFQAKVFLGFVVATAAANPFCQPARCQSESQHLAVSQQEAKTEKVPSAYVNAALEKVLDAWSKSHVAQTAKNTTTVSFSVAKDGSVSKLFITGSSGNSHQDYAAVETIIHAASFPPLPSAEETLSIEAHLGAIADKK